VRGKYTDIGQPASDSFRTITVNVALVLSVP
jgi:hypothetical protein